MIRCFKYRKLLMPYIEGALPEEKRIQVEQHLGRCSACASEAASLGSVSSALRQADVPPAEPSTDLWMRVQAIIEEPVHQARPWWQLKSLQAASMAGAAIVLVMAVVAIQQPVPVAKNNSAPTSRAAAPLPKVAQVPKDIEEIPAPAPSPPKTVEKSRKTIAPKSIKPEVTRSESSVHVPDDSGSTSSLLHDERTASVKPPVRTAPDSNHVMIAKVPDDTPLEIAGTLADGQDPSEPFITAPTADASSTPDSTLYRRNSEQLEKKDDKLKREGPASVFLQPGPAAAASDKISEVAKSRTPAVGMHYNQTTQYNANVLKEQGLLDKEIAEREKLSKSAPKNAGNWLALGKAYELANKKAKAKEAYLKAVEFGDDAIKREAEERMKKLGT